MKVKKGDTVKILSGKDKGKVAEVLQAFPSRMKVIVKDVNVVTKHIKPRANVKESGRVRMEMPLDVSNVQIIDPATGLSSRVGYEIVDGKKTRVFKRKAEKAVKKPAKKDSKNTKEKSEERLSKKESKKPVSKSKKSTK